MPQNCGAPNNNNNEDDALISDCLDGDTSPTSPSSTSSEEQQQPQQQQQQLPPVIELFFDEKTEENQQELTTTTTTAATSMETAEELNEFLSHQFHIPPNYEESKRKRTISICLIKAEEILQGRRFQSPILELPAPVIEDFLYLGGARMLNQNLLQGFGITHILNAAINAVPRPSFLDEDDFARRGSSSSFSNGSNGSNGSNSSSSDNSFEQDDDRHPRRYSHENHNFNNNNNNDKNDDDSNDDDQAEEESPNGNRKKMRHNTPRHFHLLEIATEDDEDYPILEKHLATAIDFINSARQAKGRVFVHCAAGMNRSAALCVGYLIKNERIPLFTALQQAFDVRPIILTNGGFVKQLVELAWDERLLV